MHTFRRLNYDVNMWHVCLFVYKYEWKDQLLITATQSNFSIPSLLLFHKKKCSTFLCVLFSFLLNVSFLFIWNLTTTSFLISVYHTCFSFFTQHSLPLLFQLPALSTFISVSSIITCFYVSIFICLLYDVFVLLFSQGCHDVACWLGPQDPAVESESGTSLTIIIISIIFS